MEFSPKDYFAAITTVTRQLAVIIYWTYSISMNHLQTKIYKPIKMLEFPLLLDRILLLSAAACDELWMIIFVMPTCVLKLIPSALLPNKNPNNKSHTGNRNWLYGLFFLLERTDANDENGRWQELPFACCRHPAWWTNQRL